MKLMGAVGEHRLRRRQFSLAYLLLLVTVAAVGAAFVRLAIVQGERLLFWLDALLVVLVGGGLSALGVWTAFHAVRVTLYWPRTWATVVRYSIRRHDGQPFYHPVVRFQTTDGRPVLAIANSGWWTRRWSIGASLPVRYRSTDPRWIEIVLPSNLWGFSIPLLIFGFLGFLALMIFGLPQFGLHGMFQ
jgi:hypothetical protein